MGSAMSARRRIGVRLVVQEYSDLHNIVMHELTGNNLLYQIDSVHSPYRDSDFWVSKLAFPPKDKITPKLFDSDQVIIFVVSNALQERQEIHKALSCVPTRMCLVFLIYSHRRDREGQEERREEMIQALSLYDYMDRMWYADTFYYSKSQKSLEKVKEWMYLSSLPARDYSPQSTRERLLEWWHGPPEILY